MYKVVELSYVTDESLEEALNIWTKRGWQFDSLHFAMNPGSKRPAMAFMLFTHAGQGGEIEREEDAKGETML